MVKDHFWKSAFLTHFGPFFRAKMAHFQGILAIAMAQIASRRVHNGLKTVFWASQVVEESIWRKFFFALGTLVDQPLAPTVHGGSCPPAPQNDHWYGGLGVLLEV